MWNKKNLSMMYCQFLFGLSFYGVMVTLAPFFLEKLQYNEADTMMVIGAFGAVGTLFAIAGGFIGDRFLGAYRSLTISFVAFTVGYLLLMGGAMATNIPLSLFGIAFVSYGRGLMSPNFAPLYKSTFDNPDLFENAFPINYSVNNVGAFTGKYIAPFLITMIAFKGNFMLAGAACSTGFAVFIMMRQPLTANANDIDRSSVSMKKWLSFFAVTVLMLALVFYMFKDMETGKIIVYVISGAAILYGLYITFTSPHSTMLRMGTIMIIVVLTTAFFVYYGQMNTSMNIVAINMMRGKLFGFIPLRPEGSAVLNPLWCMVAGPVITFVFTRLEKRNIKFSTATKVGFAFILTTIAFSILTFSLKSVGEEVILKPEVFFFVHLFQAFAEVIVGSLVVAFILSVAPKYIASFCVSMFMVAIALSGIIGAQLSTSIALEKGMKVTQEIATEKYAGFYMQLTIWAAACVVVTFITTLIIGKMLKAADAWDAENPAEAQSEAKA